MIVGEYATRNVVCITPQDSIDCAIVLMEEHGIHHLPVLSGGRLVGMLSDRDILLAVGWKLSGQSLLSDYDRIDAPAPGCVEEIMSRPVMYIPAEESARHAARVMVERRIGALPVMRDGELSGILTETDLLVHLQRRGERAGAARDLLVQPVGALMRGAVITVAPRDSLTRLVETIQRRRIRHLPVVNDGALVGIISDRDVRRALGERRGMGTEFGESEDDSGCEPLARDIMTREVWTVSLHHTVADVVDRLLGGRIHGLPVVRRERELVGIVTQTDVVMELARRDVL